MQVTIERTLIQKIAGFLRLHRQHRVETAVGQEERRPARSHRPVDAPVSTVAFAALSNFRHASR
jgi:hypothetical protein